MSMFRYWSVALAAALFSCGITAAAEELPRWSLEIKGGSFFPDEDKWKGYYGDDKTGQFSMALAWKPLRQLELGIDGARIRDRGQGVAPQQGELSGEVTLDLYPMQIFVLARGVFSEGQWLVPYLGGGWSRIYYEQDIRGQETRRGSATGSHLRGGIQLLLDNIDRPTAAGFHDSFGVLNSYLFIEVSRSSVEIGAEPVQLGGTSYQAGLLFEF
ncbi:MAG TPA: hypothetical protein ENJ43_03415 [Gammaproteobacteria bacterium]|nr:hypothetical protein [Gammaproteobacteria bacterium]